MKHMIYIPISLMKKAIIQSVSSLSLEGNTVFGS